MANEASGSPGPKDQESWYQRLLPAVAGGAGLAAYVYAVGGAVVYLRYAGKHLPATAALAVVSARQLLVVGGVAVIVIGITLAVVLLFEYLVGKLISFVPKRADRLFSFLRGQLALELATPARGQTPADGAGTSADGAGTPAEGAGTPAEGAGTPADGAGTPADGAERPRPRDVLGAGFVAGTSALLTVAVAAGAFAVVGSSVLSSGKKGAAHAVFVNAALVVVAVTVAVTLLLPVVWYLVRGTWGGYKKLPRWVQVVLVLVFICLCGGSLSYFSPLRLHIATIQLSDGMCVRGLFLDRNADGIYLVAGSIKGHGPVNRQGMAVGQPATMFSVAPSDIADVEIGRLYDVSTQIHASTCFPPVGLVAARKDTAIARVYLERVLEDRAQLVSALTDGWRIPPPVPIDAFNIPVVDGTALASVSGESKAVVDLGRLHGQLEITYDGWQHSGTRKWLEPIDRRRICRTIRFMNVVERDFAKLPGIQPADYMLPPRCEPGRHTSL